MTSPSYQQFRELMARRAHADAVAFAETECARSGGADVFWLTQLSWARREQGRPGEALQAADQGLAADPRNAFALAARADALRALERSAEALGAYEELTANPRLSQRAAEGTLACLAALGRWPELEQRLAACALPAARRLAWRVRLLTGRRQTVEALAACGEWLRAAPDHPAALWALVELELARDGLATVLERWSRLARIPSRPMIYREIHASLCRRAGRNDEAVREYQAIAAAGGDGRVRRKEAFALARAGREGEAIPIMEELLRDRPQDPYLNRAYEAACRRSRELERAWRFYAELAARHPGHSELAGRRQRISRMLGETAG